MANTTYNTVTVTTNATLIVAATGKRKGLIIVNTDTSETLYVGPDANITTANAIPIQSQSTLIMAGFDEAWMSNVYGIVGTGTADVRFWAWNG